MKIPLSQTSLSDKPKKQPKSYNIKLPKLFQSRFRKPYDKFLIGLLTNSSLLNTDDFQTAVLSTIPGPLDWFVWLNGEDRDTFRSVKAEYMPHVTNSRYLLALLTINDRLGNPKYPLSTQDSSESLIRHGTTSPYSRPTGTIITNSKPSRLRESYKINGIELLTKNDS
jgi:hypothetical protein